MNNQMKDLRVNFGSDKKSYHEGSSNNLAALLISMAPTKMITPFRNILTMLNSILSIIYFIIAQRRLWSLRYSTIPLAIAFAGISGELINMLLSE